MNQLKHRKFKADRFVDIFAKYSHLLRDFARCFDKSRFSSKDDFNLDAFKKLISKTNNPNMLEHLYRAYDMSKDVYGHEVLCAVIKDNGWLVDHTLPVECLAIWLHNQNQDAFNFAYNRIQFNHLEKVTMYRVDPPKNFDPGNGHLKAFTEELKKTFQTEKGSSNVMVRQYIENNCLNIIIYHETRTQAQLIFKDKSAVEPLMLRPAKQDFVCFNYTTGELQINASYTKEKRAIRRETKKGRVVIIIIFSLPVFHLIDTKYKRDD